MKVEMPNRMAIAPTILFFLKQMPQRRKYRKLQKVLTMAGNTRLAGVKVMGDSSLMEPSTFCNFLYFLLCGICFKKNKIVGAIAILFGISTFMSLLGGLIIPHLDLEQFFMNFDAMDEQTAARWVVGLMNASVAFTCLLTVGLGWGVWRRIKTLQH